MASSAMASSAMPLASLSLPKLKPSSATWASGDLGGLPSGLPKRSASPGKLGSLPKSPLDWVMKYARLSVVQLRADNDAHHSFVPLGVGKVATDGSTDCIQASPRAASTRDHGPYERRAHYLVPTHHQVLLGAAGDLARKKTFPSLFKLYLGRYLPQNMAIVGCDGADFHPDVRTALPFGWFSLPSQ